MSQESAEHYAQSMIGLSYQARSVIRDLNPKVCGMIYKLIIAVFDLFRLYVSVI